jgi:hypothetical protein
MAARYIPPHLRSENRHLDSKVPGTDVGTELFHSLREIEQYYWPSIEERTVDHTRTTLHASAQNQEALSYVLVFHGAQPRWKDDGILFVKSNLDLLPVELAGELTSSSSNNNGSHAQSEDSKTSATPTKAAEQGPIAAFSETPDTHGVQKFKFDGWYRITRVAFLAPHSPELERMLEQKGSFAKHGGKSEHEKAQYCNAKLKVKWAVVKLTKDEKATDERGNPNIRSLGVNEMLRLLRLTDGNSKTNNTPDALKGELDSTAIDATEGKEQEEEEVVAQQQQG